MFVAGSMPSVRIPDGAKPFSKVPSLLPISTTRSSALSPKRDTASRASAWKCSVIDDEVEVTYT